MPAYTVTRVLTVPAPPVQIVLCGDRKRDHWVFTAKQSQGHKFHPLGEMRTTSLPAKLSEASEAALDWLTQACEKNRIYLVAQDERANVICIVVNVQE